MKNYAGSAIWITGASSGIGEATAYRFASLGANLILTARSIESLESVAQKCRQLGAPAAEILSCDLGCLDELPDLASRAWSVFGALDLVFLNAGISMRGLTAQTDMSVIRKVMDVDYFAPVIITKTILPLMLQRGSGHLAVTSSINGRFGFPLRCAYSSAKHALYGFFETLRAEYYDEGIRVTMVCPGRVNTRISFNALEADGKLHAKLDAGQGGGISSEKAADIIVRALSKEKNEVLVGGKELLMVYIKRFFPSLCAYLSRKINPM